MYRKTRSADHLCYLPLWGNFEDTRSFPADLSQEDDSGAGRDSRAYGRATLLERLSLLALLPVPLGKVIEATCPTDRDTNKNGSGRYASEGPL